MSSLFLKSVVRITGLCSAKWLSCGFPRIFSLFTLFRRTAGRTTAVTPPPPPPPPPACHAHGHLGQESLAPRCHARGADIDIDDCSGGGGRYAGATERALKSVVDGENSLNVGGVFPGGRREDEPVSLLSGNIVAWRSSDVGDVTRGGAGDGDALGSRGGQEPAEAMAAVVGAALRGGEGKRGGMEEEEEEEEEEEPRRPRLVSEALSEAVSEGGAVDGKGDAAKEEVTTTTVLRIDLLRGRALVSYCQ